MFDDYEIIREVEKKYNQRRFIVKCKICGHEKICSLNNMRRQDNSHSKLNCKDDFYKPFIGKRFGDYVCTGISHSDGYEFELTCSICGHKVKNSGYLQNGLLHVPSRCLSDYYKAEIGKKYGDYVIREVSGYISNNISFICECSVCHTRLVKTLRSLKKNTFSHGLECWKAVPNSKYKRAICNRFNNMKERCNNPNNTSYAHYGGRGIKLLYEHPVDLYYDFIEELKEHSSKYGLRNSTFDRIDVNGNYEKTNLRIVTQSVQSTNTTRKTVFIIEKDGEKVLSDNPMECGRILGISGRSLGNVIRGSSKTAGGWKLVKVLSNKEDIEETAINEDVTTKIIVS